MLRGALLCGGFVGAWGLHDAVAPDAAQAAEPARPCVLADLLDDTRALVGQSVVAPLRLPAPSSTGSGGVDTGSGGVDTGGGPAAADPGRPTADGRRVRPATVAPSPVERAGVAEVIAPVTRSVVDLASPVVEAVAPARLLEPVTDVVRPVTEPIADLLPPVLAPVLDLTEPILGPPGAPPTPPEDPIAPTPAPAGQTPAAGTPAVSTRPATPAVVRPAKAASPRPASRSAGRHEVSPGPAEVRMPPPGKSAPAPGETPLTPTAPTPPATTAGSGAGTGGPGIPAEGSARAWDPELRLLGYDRGRGDALVNRANPPDPRPA
ncbi:hypothetical protein RMN56_08545 [Micromonospora halotolerans]|uniref:Uncharacterized protein n=1 Tax=Micromonospora halotolerans TaxID=709879 RepID=A0ABZ0A1R1_9ACTN|nr:hypothetical protein [Micromonospora halotolerans]WNM41375.1 hypothetical protein RMN56_08545 [Micromonospora halotolerans]